MSTSIIFLSLIIIVCFLLVVVIMVQNPKGGGLSGTFGGGGQQMGGVKKTDDFLNRSTWTLATLLLVLVLLFNVGNTGGSSIQESRLLDGETPSSIPPTPQNNTPSDSQDQSGDTFNLDDLNNNSDSSSNN